MKKAKWFIAILLWQIVGFVVTLLVSIPAGNFHHFIHQLIICLTFTNIVGTGGALLFLFYLKFFKASAIHKAIQFTILFLALLVIASLAAKFSMWIGMYICGLDDFIVNRWHLTIIVVNFIVMVIISLFAILLALYEKLAANFEKKIRENEKLQRLHIESKLALLQSKINPHFLFNTLNTMLDTVKRDPNQVEKMILNLSDIYRKTLTMPDNELVSLQDEIKLVQEYLEIEKVRMGERLTYSFDVSPELNDIKIPPMMLQILVENAIKHGLSPKKEGGDILVSISKSGDNLVMQVNDSGVGVTEKKNHDGFGLYSIQQRLKLLYETARLDVKRLESGGTCAEVVLPYGV